jgi:hypothetical protein
MGTADSMHVMVVRRSTSADSRGSLPLAVTLTAAVQSSPVKITRVGHAADGEYNQ